MKMIFKVRRLAELPVAMTTFDDAVEKTCVHARAGSGGMDIHLINAYSIALTTTDERYRQCLNGASYNLPDGKPLSLLTRFSSQALSQVRGPSYFEAVLDVGRSRNLRHFLLGSTPETLEALKRAINLKFPGVLVVGADSPPFRSLSSEEIQAQDARLKEANPDIVWVGLGTPKQDLEARRLADAGFNAIAVGAAFDFTAGLKKEAPRWISNIGAEWLFRFATEPRRLWRRYLIGNFQFLYAVMRKRNL